MESAFGQQERLPSAQNFEMSVAFNILTNFLSLLTGEPWQWNAALWSRVLWGIAPQTQRKGRPRTAPSTPSTVAPPVAKDVAPPVTEDTTAAPPVDTNSALPVAEGTTAAPSAPSKTTSEAKLDSAFVEAPTLDHSANFTTTVVHLETLSINCSTMWFVVCAMDLYFWDRITSLVGGSPFVCGFSVRTVVSFHRHTLLGWTGEQSGAGTTHRRHREGPPRARWGGGGWYNIPSLLWWNLAQARPHFQPPGSCCHLCCDRPRDRCSCYEPTLPGEICHFSQKCSIWKCECFSLLVSLTHIYASLQQR